MISPAHNLALYLEAQGVGAFGGSEPWCISVGGEPALPESVVTLYDTGGTVDTDEVDHRANVQVRIRGRSYPEVYQKQIAIRDLVSLPATVAAPAAAESEDTVDLVVIQDSDVLSLGQDDNDRYVLVVNYVVMKQRS